MSKKIIIVIFTMLFILTGCSRNNNQEYYEETDVLSANTNEDVVNDKIIDVFQLTNTSLIWENNRSVLETTITNTSEKSVKLNGFLIHIKDDNGKNILTLTGYVGSEIKAHESKVMNTYHYENLTNVSNITYELID